MTTDEITDSGDVGGAARCAKYREVGRVEAVNLAAVADVLPYWNVHDIDGVLDFYDSEIVWRNVAMEETYAGLVAVRGFLGEMFTAFPDLTFDVKWRIAHGDEVAEEWMMSGTHAGPFMGIPGTGRKFTLTGMSHLIMRDGRFLSDTFYFDSGSFLRQVRLLPPLRLVRSPVGRAVLWTAVHRGPIGGAVLTAAATLHRRGAGRNDRSRAL